MLPPSRAQALPRRLPAALHSGVSAAAGPFLAAPGASHREGGRDGGSGGAAGPERPAVPPRSEPSLERLGMERSQNEHLAKKLFSICASRPRRAAPAGRAHPDPQPPLREEVPRPPRFQLLFIRGRFRDYLSNAVQRQNCLSVSFLLESLAVFQTKSSRSVERSFPTSFEKDVAAFLHRGARPLAVLSTKSTR